MKKIKSTKKIDILTLIDVKLLQSIQDFFARTLNLTMVSVYKNNWITDTSNASEFCRMHMKNSKFGYKLCDKCHQSWENAAIKELKPVICKCHANITCFVVPAFVEGNYVGCLIAGQALTEEVSEEILRKKAKNYDINEEEYISTFKKLRVVSMDKIESASELLFSIINSIAQLAYFNYTSTNSKIKDNNHKIFKNTVLENWLCSNYKPIKRPISGRELEVLKLIVKGKNNTEIAKELSISIHTAKAHVSSIIEKLNAEDRVQVAVRAVREGWA